MDFTTNNCGMYWSDGKIQSSVSEFETEPVNEFDATCQEHDRSYSTALVEGDLVTADNKFYDQNVAKGLKRNIAANLVKYGNRTMRFSLSLPGLVLGELGYLFNMNKRLVSEVDGPRGGGSSLRGSQSQVVYGPSKGTPLAPIPEGSSLYPDNKTKAIMNDYLSSWSPPVNLRDPPLLFRNTHGKYVPGPALLNRSVARKKKARRNKVYISNK
jgi:hypothetical protein